MTLFHFNFAFVEKITPGTTLEASLAFVEPGAEGPHREIVG